MCLGLLEAFVIVCLELYEWLKDISILLGVFVSEENWVLHFFLLYFSFQIFNLGKGLLLPDFFKLIDLLRGDLPGLSKFNFRGKLDEPAEKSFVLNESLPVLHIPTAFFH